ncbi:MAG: hypothetical protein KJO21_12275 [Verrucomicrobiae bacterium]|nr:hypothetical protein [Verrucomicrobiae bacterium]NNJ43995.1 hypothetical protein [Akkermansiaceae bacterium]
MAKAATTATALCLAVCPTVLAQSTPDYDLAPVHYSTSQDDNTITRLQQAMDNQERVLPGQTGKQALNALLAELHIPVSSQTLVFSKTSLQREFISPTNPRAVYFNRDFYVGYVPGGVIEVIACDDPKGMMFYSLNPNRPVKKRKFIRSQECMTCHASRHTSGVPGLLVRSVFPEKNGQPLLAWGTSLTTTASPLSERWGGWYVTGNHGKSMHRGNKWVSSSDTGQHSFPKSRGQNVTDLSAYFDTQKHLTDTSDILALMVMEHQIEVHNTLSAATMGYARHVYLGKAINEGEYDLSSAVARKMIDGYADSILKVLLFTHEMKLPEDGIDGSEAFQQAFSQQGPRHAGHSLRDLRLEKRLFKYRCSYMIYSKSFEMLPDPIKTRVLTQVHQLVTDKKQDARFPRLSSREKSRIHTILFHTHPAYRHVAVGQPTP